MTVNVEIPYVDLTGDGVITVFAFDFSLVDEYDLFVMLDDGTGLVLQVPATTYTVTINPKDMGGIEGGIVTFLEAPAADVRVLIFRSTTKSQQVDYVEGDPFPVESHEKGYDKFTYILQELITGAWTGRDSNGEYVTLTFDLSVLAEETTVTILNSGGTDAVIPPWVSAETAGVFHGEVTTEAPIDEDPTDKPDGYMWIEIPS